MVDEDKKRAKAFNPYAPGGKLAQAQQRQTNAATGLVQRFNETMIDPLTAPFKAAGKAVMESGPVKRIAADASRSATVRDNRQAQQASVRRFADAGDNTLDPLVQQTATANRLASSERQPGSAMAAESPTAGGRGLMDTNIGSQKSFAPQPGRGITPELSPRDEQIKAGLAEIDKRIATGAQASPEQMAKIQQMKQQAGFLRGGTDRVPVGPDGLPLNRQPQQNTQQRLEGMNPTQNTRTTSDGYTFEGAAGDAGRFFAPTGKGNPEAEANWAKAGQQWEARQPQQKVFRAAPAKPPELLTKENSPNMGWKERTRLNEQMLSNFQSGQNTATNARTQVATNAASNRTDLERGRMSERTAMDGNQIQRMNVEDQMAGRALDNEGRGLENQAKQFTLNEQQQIDALRQRAQAPNVTPEEMKQINNALRLFGKGDKESGLKTFDTTTEDVMGNKTTTPHFYNDQGYQGRAIPDGQNQQGPPPPKGQVPHGHEENYGGVLYTWDKKQQRYIPKGNQ